MVETKVWGPTASVTALVPHTPHEKSIWTRLKANWGAIQVENQGAYSLERLEGLGMYCQSTSLRRVVLLCVISPIPALMAALLVECFPLQSPSEGWAANWVFWLRLLLTQIAIGVAANSQMARLIPGLKFTLSQRVAVALGTAVAFQGTCLLAASQIGFPLPFMMQFGAVPIGIFTTIMTRLVLGSALFAKASPLKVHADRYNRFFGSFMILCGVFPIYKVLYLQLPMAYRGVAVLILPIWKFAARHFIVHGTRELEDVMPALVALSVDFQSTLFIAVCMSSSGSTAFMLLFIVVNIAQSLLELRAMSDNGRALLLDEREKLQTVNRTTDSTNLLTIMSDAVQASASLPLKSLERVRIWSCLPCPLPKEKIERLRLLEVSGVYGGRSENRGKITVQMLQQNSQRRESNRTHSASIAPSPVSTRLDGPAESQAELFLNSQAHAQHSQRSRRIVVQGVQLLFHSECVALVQYVESIVPVVFLVFKSVLERLPNVVYYPGGAGNWGMDSISNILILAVLEIGLLLSFSRVLRHRFGFSPLYQLAFVLETQFYVVQMVFFVFILVMLQYELEHFGRYPPSLAL